VKKRKIRAITPFKVIQGHRGRYQSKVCMRLPIYFCDQFVALKFVTADVTAVFSAINLVGCMVIFGDEDKILIKKSLYLKGYTAKSSRDDFPDEWQLRLSSVKAKDVTWSTCCNHPALFRANHILSKKILKYFKYFVTVTHKCTQQRIEEWKSLHLKCNLFAFSSISAEYMQKN